MTKISSNCSNSTIPFSGGPAVPKVLKWDLTVSDNTSPGRLWVGFWVGLKGWLNGPGKQESWRLATKVRFTTLRFDRGRRMSVSWHPRPFFKRMPYCLSTNQTILPKVAPLRKIKECSKRSAPTVLSQKRLLLPVYDFFFFKFFWISRRIHHPRIFKHSNGITRTSKCAEPQLAVSTS